jgi:hypothetical protein
MLCVNTCCRSTQTQRPSPWSTGPWSTAAPALPISAAWRSWHEACLGRLWLFISIERKIVSIFLSRLCLISLVLAASSRAMAGGGGGGGGGGGSGADGVVYSLV